MGAELRAWVVHCSPHHATLACGALHPCSPHRPASHPVSKPFSAQALEACWEWEQAAYVAYENGKSPAPLHAPPTHSAQMAASQPTLPLPLLITLPPHAPPPTTVPLRPATPASTEAGGLKNAHPPDTPSSDLLALQHPVPSTDQGVTARGAEAAAQSSPGTAQDTAAEFSSNAAAREEAAESSSTGAAAATATPAEEAVAESSFGTAQHLAAESSSSGATAEAAQAAAAQATAAQAIAAEGSSSGATGAAAAAAAAAVVAASSEQGTLGPEASSPLPRSRAPRGTLRIEASSPGKVRTPGSSQPTLGSEAGSPLPRRRATRSTPRSEASSQGKEGTPGSSQASPNLGGRGTSGSPRRRQRGSRADKKGERRWADARAMLLALPDPKGQSSAGVLWCRGLSGCESRGVGSCGLAAVLAPCACVCHPLGSCAYVYVGWVQ